MNMFFFVESTSISYALMLGGAVLHYAYRFTFGACRKDIDELLIRLEIAVCSDFRGE
jgi:hypothetical protein